MTHMKKYTDVLYQITKVFEEHDLSDADIMFISGSLFRIGSDVVGRNTLESSVDLYEIIYKSIEIRPLERHNRKWD